MSHNRLTPYINPGNTTGGAPVAVATQKSVKTFVMKQRGAFCRTKKGGVPFRYCCMILELEDGGSFVEVFIKNLETDQEETMRRHSKDLKKCTDFMDFSLHLFEDFKKDVLYMPDFLPQSEVGQIITKWKAK